MHEAPKRADPLLSPVVRQSVESGESTRVDPFLTDAWVFLDRLEWSIFLGLLHIPGDFPRKASRDPQILAKCGISLLLTPGATLSIPRIGGLRWIVQI